MRKFACLLLATILIGLTGCANIANPSTKPPAATPQTILEKLSAQVATLQGQVNENTTREQNLKEQLTQVQTTLRDIQTTLVQLQTSINALKK